VRHWVRYLDLPRLKEKGMPTAKAKETRWHWDLKMGKLRPKAKVTGKRMQKAILMPTVRGWDLQKPMGLEMRMGLEMGSPRLKEILKHLEKDLGFHLQRGLNSD